MLLAVFAAAALAGAPASAAAECDPVMPKSEVAAGMTGTGWTVARGRTREPFSVEILGVLKDAIAPGRDMILVEATSPSIGRANGIWFGMSGSPVYVGGRLVGALAFGMGGVSGNSAIGGLTPAEDMLRVLSYPLAGAQANVAPSPRVVLPRSAARDAAARLGISEAKASSLTQLKVPFSVSGVDARGLERVARYANARKLPLLPIAGASASKGSGAAATAIEPGDNLAAVASYGDVTLAGVGTASYVCESKVLAFGHPLGLFGPTTLGLSHADALGVIPGFEGGFKVATVAEPFGRIDQDRLAGLRGLVGQVPATTPVRSSVVVPSQGSRLDGGTDIVLEPFAGLATFLQVGMSIESAFDGFRPGTSRLSWTIEGTRANGASWRLVRSNLFAGPAWIGFESGSEVATHVDMILGNPFEDVRISGVRVDASVREGMDVLYIERVLVAKGRAPFKKRASVRPRPGERVRVRVILKHAERGRPNRRVDLAFRMPRNAPPVGLIEITGAAWFMDEEECMMEGGESCGGGSTAKSFTGLLRELQNAPRNNVLTGKLRVAPRFRVRVTRSRAFDAVIRGDAMIRIGGRGGRGGGEEEFEG